MDEKPHRLRNEWIGCGIVATVVLAITAALRIAISRSGEPNKIVMLAAWTCMAIVLICGGGVVIVGIMRAFNQKDDPRRAKRPIDDP